MSRAADELPTGVTLAFTFPLGRFHATAMGTSANDGVVEWPPSPWRILRALVSVWKTRHADLDPELVESTLAALSGDPSYYVDPRSSIGHTRHYMPIDKGGEETTTLVHDTFISIAADRPTLYASWPLASLDDNQRGVLARLAGSLTWLGRAESLVDARLVDPSDEIPATNTHVLQGDGAIAENPLKLLVPTVPLDLGALCVDLQDMRSDRKTRATLPPKAVLRTYERPVPESMKRSSPRAIRRQKSTAVRFALVPWEADRSADRNVPQDQQRSSIAAVEAHRSAARLRLSDAIIHTSLLRRTAMSRYGRLTGGGGSATLSGREPEGPRTGHHHAHYLPLAAPGVMGQAHLIERFMVWAPEGFDDDELRALQGIRNVKGWDWVSGSRDFRVVVDGIGSPIELAPHLHAQAAHWSSITPVVPGRHHRGRRSWEDQVRLEIAHSLEERGLPAASIDVKRWEGPFLTSRPRAGHRPHGAHPQRFTATLTFQEPIRLEGPLCLGAQSHFGLGMFRPGAGADS